jgi:hypothetical protein
MFRQLQKEGIMFPEHFFTQNPAVATPCGFDPRHRHHNPTEILIEFQWGSFFIPIYCSIRAFQPRNRENLLRYSAPGQVFYQYLSHLG